MIAQKTDPKLWQTAKRLACTSARLCDHSARKMQWAVRYYKSHGGQYTTARSGANSLARWTRQKWRTHTRKPSRGKLRYLPDAAWKHLSPDQVRRTNASKRRGTRDGKQWVPQPSDVAAVAKRYRKR